VRGSCEAGGGEADSPAILSLPGQGQRVLMVHGLNQIACAETELLIRDMGLYPSVLLGQPSGGSTIVEKIEGSGDADFAVVLLTLSEPPHRTRRRRRLAQRGRMRE
jgi:predicted nucleotide-binding protein